MIAALRSHLTPDGLRQIAASIPRRDYPVYALVVIWVLTMISLPIVRWTLGDDALPAGITVGVAMQIAAVLVTLGARWGVARTLLVTAIVAISAWAFEYVGHTTDFPFGAYDYTERLQPQIGDVPVLIPLAWMMMLPPAWAVSHLITRRYTGRRGRIAFIGVASLALTAWDLYLDPQMVAWSLWIWGDPSGFSYFGIPWINYAGWLLAGVTITGLASIVIRRETLPIVPLLVVYVITWLLEFIGLLFFWGLPGPAVIGFIGMGLMLAWAARASRK